MAGLVPAIHVFYAIDRAKTWMPGIKPGMTTLRNRNNKKPGRIS
jgi:hypothetical protein